MRFSAIGVIALSLGLTGCFPALVTVQPEAKFLVQDANGQPIESATVTLATHRMPFGGLRSGTRTELSTDAAGKVSLQADRDWEWQIMLPDGTSSYTWVYCIDKPGYRPVTAEARDFSKPVVAVLERSDKRMVCKWPSGDESYYQVSVIEE